MSLQEGATRPTKIIELTPSKGDAMSNWFYLDESGTKGPISATELQALRDGGRITPNTMVWSLDDLTEPSPVNTTTAPDLPSEQAEWHYARGREKVGPVTKTEILRLIAGKDLTSDTLVWSPKLGRSFVPLAETELAGHLTTPPALPSERPTDIWAWIAVAIPVVFALVENFGDWDFKESTWILAIIAANTVACWIDTRFVEASPVFDRQTNLNGWGMLIVPVYLYKRAKGLRARPLHFWLWWVSILASVAISMTPQ